MTIALIGVEYSALLMLVLQHRVMKRMRVEAQRPTQHGALQSPGVAL